jgi:chromosome segregation ATPase
MTKRKCQNVIRCDKSGTAINFLRRNLMAREIHNFAVSSNLTDMPKKPLYLLLIAGFLLSCDQKGNEALQFQVDSLKMELERSHEATEALSEIGVLLDSIDATRQLLRVNLVEGTPYDDYTGRIQELNQYIRTTQSRIEELEQSLKGSKANAQAFSKAINQLKAELKNKDKEVAFLQEQVEQFRKQNETLMITVDLQDAEIADKQAQIDAKSQELALIEARVQELMIQSKVSEAQAYYLRAQAIETAAERTRLAPRKKKETIKEALDLYKKALSLGLDEAQTKITELEKRL